MKTCTLILSLAVISLLSYKEAGTATQTPPSRSTPKVTVSGKKNAVQFLPYIGYIGIGDGC